jgi:hypothetical protein
MKMRLTKRLSTVDGQYSYMVYYKSDTPDDTTVESEWVYYNWFPSEVQAREFIDSERENYEAPEVILEEWTFVKRVMPQ